MAIVCPFCSAENRDKARFCRGCARPLDRLDEEPAPDASDDPARARRRARRRRAAAAAAKNARPAWSRWMGVMVATGIALGVGWWLGTRQTAPSPAQAAPLPVATVPAPAVPPVVEAPPPTPANSGATAATAPTADTASAASAVDRLRQSVELLEHQDRARAAALEQQRTKLMQDRQRADEARRRTDALAAAAAGTTLHVAPAPAPAPAPVAQAPAAAAVTAAAAPSVDQLCAGSSNVFARDFCRMRECGKAVFATDPVCVRFRQMDEARRADN